MRGVMEKFWKGPGAVQQTIDEAASPGTWFAPLDKMIRPRRKSKTLLGLE